MIEVRTAFNKVPRLNLTQTISVTPTITAGTYSNGMQIGGILTFPNIIRTDPELPFGSAQCVEVTILDADQQDSAFDLKFFNQSPIVTSSDHQAYAQSSPNQKLQSIGYVSIGGSYSDNSGSNNSESSNPHLDKPLYIPSTVPNPANIYGILVCRGAPTYRTTSSLQFQVTFFPD